MNLRGQWPVGPVPTALSLRLAAYRGQALVIEVDDVAEVVAFLASDAASYITVDNLSVSGGMDVHTRP